MISEPHANGVGIHGWEGFGNKNSVWEFVVDKDDSISKPVVGIRNVASKFLLNIWEGNNKDGAEVKFYANFDLNSKFILHYTLPPNIVAFESLSARRFLNMGTHSSSSNGAIIHTYG